MAPRSITRQPPLLLSKRPEVYTGEECPTCREKGQQAQGVEGEEGKMSEALILAVISGLMGIVGMLIGSVINDRLRERQMKALWAEEERRRQSDRRRDLYDRELRVVSDSVDAVSEALAKLDWMDEAESAADLIREVSLMVEKAHLVTVSLGDRELQDGYEKLINGFVGWFHLLDLSTEEPIEGRENEVDEFRVRTEAAAQEAVVDLAPASRGLTRAKGSQQARSFSHRSPLLKNRQPENVFPFSSTRTNGGLSNTVKSVYITPRDLYYRFWRNDRFGRPGALLCTIHLASLGLDGHNRPLSSARRRRGWQMEAETVS